MLQFCKKKTLHNLFYYICYTLQHKLISSSPSAASKRIATRLIASPRRPFKSVADSCNKYARLGRAIDSRAVHPKLCVNATGGRIVFAFYFKRNAAFLLEFYLFLTTNGIGFKVSRQSRGAFLSFFVFVFI